MSSYSLKVAPVSISNKLSILLLICCMFQIVTYFCKIHLQNEIDERQFYLRLFPQHHTIFIFINNLSTGVEIKRQEYGNNLDETKIDFCSKAVCMFVPMIFALIRVIYNPLTGVEIGSDVEIKWTAHLLQLNVHGISKALVTKLTEVRSANPLSPGDRESVALPLNIDQALDARDAIAKALYSSLFTWLVARINKICSHKSHRKQTKNIISLLDLFGFEDFNDNSFEQLCINFANESLQYHFNKYIFKVRVIS